MTVGRLELLSDISNARSKSKCQMGRHNTNCRRSAGKSRREKTGNYINTQSSMYKNKTDYDITYMSKENNEDHEERAQIQGRIENIIIIIRIKYHLS